LRSAYDAIGTSVTAATRSLWSTTPRHPRMSRSRDWCRPGRCAGQYTPRPELRKWPLGANSKHKWERYSTLDESPDLVLVSQVGGG
jgi:hypothetical protein